MIVLSTNVQLCSYPLPQFYRMRSIIKMMLFGVFRMKEPRRREVLTNVFRVSYVLIFWSVFTIQGKLVLSERCVWIVHGVGITLCKKDACLRNWNVLQPVRRTNKRLCNLCGFISRWGIVWVSRFLKFSAQFINSRRWYVLEGTKFILVDGRDQVWNFRLG